MNDRVGEGRQPSRPQTKRGAGDTESRNHAAAVVTHRSAEAAQALLEFFVIDGVPALTDATQLPFEEGRASKSCSS